MNDFSHEHILGEGSKAFYALKDTIVALNFYRDAYLHGNEDFEPKDKRLWWQMIQLLPSSYNQKRTVMCNYEVLCNMFAARCNHKLDEWKQLCGWMRTLPYADLITGEK